MSEEGFGAEDEESYHDITGDGGSSHAAQLREAVDAIDVSNSLTAPLKVGLDALLQLAANAVGSHEASILVRDGNEGGLRFLTAISDVAEALLKLRIPPGKGIAGLVFSSGQPMSVSDASSEGSFWSEADKKTGFKTITLLATPLRTGNEIVGVLEFVNRPGEPPYPPFTPEEMDHAAYFGGVMARMIDAYELAELLESLFDRSIKTLMTRAEGTRDSLSAKSKWVHSLAAAPEHRDLMLIWISVQEIFRRGEAERELCRDLVEDLARFVEKRSANSTRYSGF
jgi:signal transduction protein with GAF and PtsI domain